MAYTYSKLASTTVGAGGTSAITFSNIPQNYTDLVLKLSVRCARAVGFTQVGIRLNGSSTSYGTNRYLTGDGATATSSTSTTQYFCYGAIWVNGANSTANSFASSELYIPNYSNGSIYKSGSVDSVGEENATTSYDSFVAGLWSNNTAISSISITEPNGATNFVQYSSASLYGIRVEL